MAVSYSNGTVSEVVRRSIFSVKGGDIPKKKTSRTICMGSSSAYSEYIRRFVQKSKLVPPRFYARNLVVSDTPKRQN